MRLWTAPLPRSKKVADSKKSVTDFDIHAIFKDELLQPEELWKLNSIAVSCGDKLHATATISITSKDGVERVDAAIGVGPVDAIYLAIDRIVQVPKTLLEYQVKSITRGTDALGEVTVRLAPDTKDDASGDILSGSQPTFNGHGASPDILVASARAYISALNKLCAARKAATENGGANGHGNAGSSNGHAVDAREAAAV
eukprot:Opistho-2@70779